MKNEVKKKKTKNKVAREKEKFMTVTAARGDTITLQLL